MQRQPQRSTNLNFLLTKKNVLTAPVPPDLFLQIPNYPFEEQSLKAFNHRLKQCLKEREGNKAQQSHHSLTEQQLIDKNDNRKILITNDHAKTKIDLLPSSIQRRRRLSKDIYSQGKTRISSKRCSFPAPLQAQEETKEPRYPQYYERLISSESSKILLDRILKRKKEQHKIQEQNNNRFVKCSLNHRIFNKICKKDSLNALIIEQSPSKTPSPSKKRHTQHFKVFNQRRPRKIEILLSPPPKPPAQSISLSTKKPTQVKTEQPEYREQLGPWSIDQLSFQS